MQKKKSKPALLFYERCLALGVAGFFIFVAILNLYLDEGEFPSPTDSPLYVQNPLIEVMIVGKVKYPGTYQVVKGKKVIEAIHLAEPFESANLKRIKLDSSITRRRKIVVP